jgi:type I restriction enzyme M protein
MSDKDSATLKADIDFEAELRNAANELPGAVAENEHKDFGFKLST